MPARRFPCPECDAPIRLSPDRPAGKKVRCPECDALVRPPADDADADAAPVRRSSRRDDDDRPRRSKSHGKKKAKSNNAALIAIPIVALVLLAVGGGILAYSQMSKKDKPTEAVAAAKNLPAEKPKVTMPPKPKGPVTVGLNVGNEAPEIEAEDLDGETFKLSDYRGKVVLLDFWGNW